MSYDPDSPDRPDTPDDIETEGKAVPPYEGRRTEADVDGKEESTKDGAKVGGATGPVEDDEMKAPEPAETPGGATGSPADEQPASQAPETGRDEEEGTVGPAHSGGTTRAEDQT